MTRVLIVEDEDHLATGLKFNLEAEGYVAEVEKDGQAALDRLTAGGNGFDLVLLDVMLPRMDGFEVVRRLRDTGIFVPVMMLTARGRAEDVLRGFELGADDYVPKPFDLSILLARIQSLLRRRDWLEERPAEPPEVEDSAFGGNRVDFAHQRLVRAGVERRLTLMEAALLRFLVRNEGKPIARETLLEEVWGVRRDTDTRAVDNFIARLRRLVEDDPARPRHLQTVRGVGYRFVAEPQDERPRRKYR
jgi:DNA-binding response OmpR family regulator